MHKPEKLELKTEEEFLPAPCGDCDRVTQHKALAKVDGVWSDGPVDWYESYRIVQCQGCLIVSFSKAHQCSEDWDHDPETGETYLPTKWDYYPSRLAGRAKMQEYHLLPRGVLQIYEETHMALCSDLRIMAGFGIRAIVEAVCKDKNVSSGNLQERIDGLCEAGYITRAGATILHSLRFMGNEAAHEMKAHQPKELGAGFDVLEHLLQGVYVLPKQAEQLPRYEN